MSRRLLVQKYGGTSVRTPERRSQLVDHVSRALASGDDLVVVVSAMGRRGDPYATDTLLDLLREGGHDVAPRDYDLMFTCGEAISAALVSHTLKGAGIAAVSLTSAQAGIFTDGRHVESEIVEIDTGRIRALLAAGQVPVVTGGQGVARGTLDYTTLGRGGSDTSAVALGAALGAHRVEIFSDVEGIAAIDPHLVPGARVLGRIGYASMFELARFGAKVLHPRSIVAGWKAGIPIAVRATGSMCPGTLVDDVSDEAPIAGLALLPPFHTVALRTHRVAAERLLEWERHGLVMHVTDASSGSLILGAGPDKEGELRAAVADAGGDPGWAEPTCWLSMVGDGEAVRTCADRQRSRFDRLGLRVLAFEMADRRCTFVLPEAARGPAGRAAYAEAFEAAASA